MSEVEWKKIENFPGYLINSLGEVHSIAKGELQRIFGRPNTKNYLQVVLYRTEGITRVKYQKYIHVLMAITFICEKPADDYQVNHIDSNRRNNRLKNLEWTKDIENYKHRDGLPYLRYDPLTQKDIPAIINDTE